MSIATSIADIIRERNASARPLLQQEERCIATLKILDGLEESLSRFLQNPNREEQSRKTCTSLLENIPRIKSQLRGLQEKIGHCRRRFERKTINIGFGGKRGQGKSFLLQKLSGLTDNEVPSGAGKTVTAVRSEIFNDEDAFAEITFYDQQGFLREVIAPYCAQLNLPSPTNIQEFVALPLPDPASAGEIQVSYLKKLAALRDHASEFVPFLTGETITERDFPRLRKYVAYTDGEGNDSYTYAAVRQVLVHTPFPKTDVRQLGLIDLPGLGELNPTVEKRHTSGFGDEVDIVLLIRRPLGPRVDWDIEDQNVLESLKNAVKDGELSEIVVLVQNEGGCDTTLANIAEKSIRETVSSNFDVLRTKGETPETLTRDVLSPILDRLARTLPVADGRTLEAIATVAAKLWRDIETYAGRAFDLLKKSNDRGFPEEEMRIRAAETRDALAARLQDASKSLNARIETEYENEPLALRIEQIQAELKEFVRTGMGTGSSEAWIARNANRIATDRTGAAVYVDTGHQMRVKIAEDFATLNQVYCDILDGLLDLVADQLDVVLPGFLEGDTGREKLIFLRDRLLASDRSFDNIVEAVNFLLDLKIDHRSQIYPRAYEPIRAFMQDMSNPDIPAAPGKTREEQAAIIYDDLASKADRVIIEIVNHLFDETKRINDILFVALEYFDDKIIRSNIAKMHWERFIQVFHREIFGTSEDASESRALQEIMKYLGILAAGESSSR